MKKRILINDTAEATFTRLSDGHLVLAHETQLASLSQTVSEEKLKGGIGNGTIALLRTDKEQELTVRNALWDAEYLAMTQGTEFKNGTTTVTKKYNGTVRKGDLDALEVVLEDATFSAATGDGAIAVSPDGTQEKGVEVTAGKFPVPVAFADAKVGDSVQVLKIEDVTGDVATFDSKKFGEKYKAQYYTIGYDPDTMEHVQDIYIIFDEVTPSGNFDMSFENGTAMTPEITFTVTNPKGKTEVGRIIRVDVTK